ncbi:MAG: stage II sporulation protein M [Thaumarchaeota archaeon]|nr:stage II sporulation protein M [Nitrososphaerota archaeon]
MIEQAAEKKEPLLDSAVKEFARRGLLLCVALFLIEVALFFVISGLPFFAGEQALYTSQSNQIGNEFQNAGLLATFWGIFTNNLRIGLIEMIPGIGLILFAFSIYATARIVEVDAISYSAPAALVFLSLFLFPHTYIELPAYAVATAEGLLLLYALFRWLFDSTGRSSVRWRTEGTQFVVNLAIVTVMLLVAALFEAVEIRLGGVLSLVTWIPFVVLVVVVLVLNRRLSRIRKEVRAAQNSVQ